MQHSIHTHQPLFDNVQNINEWRPRHQAHDHSAGTVYQPSGNVDQILAERQCPGIMPTFGQDIALEEQRQVVGYRAMPEVGKIAVEVSRFARLL